MTETIPGLNIRRIAEAVFYEAPNHFDIRGMRLQGLEAGGSEKSWIGLSHILPGGRAGPDSTPVEKTYVILSGELTIRANGQQATLGRLDSCCILPGTEREIVNLTNEVVTMLVVIPRVEAA